MRTQAVCSVLVMALSLSLSLAPRRVEAWGSIGHQICGEIAWQHLTPEARAAWVELAGGTSLAKASLWADEVRLDPEYAWAKPLHYVNVSIEAAEYSEDSDCPGGECVVAAIHRFEIEALDPAISSEKRLEAIKFLVHFTQDLHQPLHVSHRDGRGGNLTNVTYLGQEQSWHGVLDSGVIRTALQPKSSVWIGYASSLNKSIGDNDIQSWTDSTPEEWANESLLFAQQLDEAWSMPDLGSDFDAAVMPKVNRRLRQAGVRLAGQLNRLLPEVP